MISGIGLDIVEIDRIDSACQKRRTFPERVLTENERLIYERLSNNRQVEFLAGRFSAKEAFSKAYGTGIGKVGFLDIEILPNENGQPYIARSPFEGKSFVTITHTGSVAAAQVILEE